MKKVLLLSMAILCIDLLYGQEIQHDVIGVSGNGDTLADVVVNWTIGECLTEHYCNTECQITQGFHQSYYKILQIRDKFLPPLDISIYPNPTTNMLNLDLSALSPGKTCRVFLSNIQGKLLLEKQVPTANIEQVFLKQYPDGMMILKIADPSSGRASSFKIIKVKP